MIFFVFVDKIDIIIAIVNFAITKIIITSVYYLNELLCIYIQSLFFLVYYLKYDIKKVHTISNWYLIYIPNRCRTLSEI